MTDVFISYSRQNKDFARKLYDKLAERGRKSWIDWEGIKPSAKWWQEIREGIEAADAFVFILTPDSLASPVCTLEVAHAIQANKRIIPVVHVDTKIEMALGHIASVQPDQALREMLGSSDLLMLARDNWSIIQHINWIFFRETDDFESAFHNLVESIKLDIDYVKRHTRLYVRAREWEANKRENDSLLIGEEVLAAENWLRESQDKQPAPTPLHVEYIEKSRVVENQRRRLLRTLRWTAGIAAVVGLIAVVTTIFAGAQAVNSLQQADVARASAAVAGTSVANAEQTLERVNEQVSTAQQVSREIATAQLMNTWVAENVEQEIGFYGVPVPASSQVKPVEYPLLFQQTGIDWWQQAGWTGAGRRVGVIAGGFANLQFFTSMTGKTIQLPDHATLEDYSNHYINEGVATFEIINQIAPGAALFACQYNGTFTEFQSCVEWLITEKVNIIYFGGGIPANDEANFWTLSAEAAVNQGILWVNSAGNFGQGFVNDLFRDVNADGYHEFNLGAGSQQELQISQVHYSGNAFINWQIDPSASSSESEASFELYLEAIDLNTGEIIAETGDQPAFQLSPITYSKVMYISALDPWGLRIRTEGGSLPATRFNLFLEFQPLDFATTLGSVIAPGDSSQVITVGALNGNVVASYSSRGLLGAKSIKPDLVTIAEILRSDGTPFIGTSASGAVVAGASALIWEANPEWTNQDVRRYLIEEAAQDDREFPGPDNTYGNGYLFLRPPVNRLLVRIDPAASPTPTYTPRPTMTVTEDSIAVVQ